ncbi:MAG: iron-only hydrogenase system regulator [Mycoplasmataceae bacterium]|jgi:iron complex transport system ATP-binding protein|nr:iron-only hydrogenase system regulator [Mycoplasmataceae bacterium]
MEKERIALLGIIVKDKLVVEKINKLLHQYQDCIIGRMGLPYKKRGLSIISIALDGSQDKIAALSGKLGAIPGINAKVIYAQE